MVTEKLGACWKFKRKRFAAKSSLVITSSLWRWTFKFNKIWPVGCDDHISLCELFPHPIAEVTWIHQVTSRCGLDLLPLRCNSIPTCPNMSNQPWTKVHSILLELRDGGNREHLQGTSREPSRLRFCWKICAKYLVFNQSDRKCTCCSRNMTHNEKYSTSVLRTTSKMLMRWLSLQPGDFLISSTHWPCRLLGAKTKVARLGTKPPNSVVGIKKLYIYMKRNLARSFYFFNKWKEDQES